MRNTSIVLAVVVLLGLGYMLMGSSKPADPKELQVTDITVGTGAEAAPGMTLSVNYVGTLFSTGVKFDSSYDRGTPFSFVLGQGSVIPGWEQGLMGMKVGGKRHLVIPSTLAYGERESGPIPANSTLVFDVELLDAKAPEVVAPVSTTTPATSKTPAADDALKVPGRK